MDQLAGSRPRQGYPTSATFWRRRVTVLALGLGLISLLSWGVNQALAAALGGGSLATGRGSGRSATGHGGGSGASGPGGRAGTVAGAGTLGATHAPAHPAVTGSATAHHGATDSPRPAVTAGGTRKPVPTPSVSPGTGRAVPGETVCPPSDVTLGLSSPRYWYDKGQWPEFTVTVISTDAQPCRANLGTRAVWVVVSNGGNQRVWSSADCAGAPLSRVVTLRPHTPVIVRRWWNRETAVPGCGTARHPVSAGSYTAVAASGRTHSKVMIFVLAAAGLAVP